MLMSLRIGTRLGLGIGGLVVLAVSAFALTVYVGHASQVETAQASFEAQQRSDTVQQMARDQLQLVSSIRSAGLQTNSVPLNRDLEQFRLSLKNLQAAEAAFAKLELDDEERAALARIVAIRTKAVPIAEEAAKFTMAMAGEEAAKALSGEFATLQADWSRELERLRLRQQERAQASNARISEDNRRKWMALSGLMLLVTIGAAGFAVVLTRSVTRPLRQARDAAARVAGGDFTITVQATGNDESAELLRSLQEMAKQLADMVNAVRESSESIALASQEICSGNVDLSARTEQQAASVQQTSATISQLTEIVQQNSSHADSARKLADKTAAIADDGGRSMARVVDTMDRISGSSKRIAEIIGVIDGIAFQTNILALNAAVEAARAGEQGRGFSVVAAEVRSLAQRVSTASSEVRSLIGESVESITAGATVVGGLGTTMGDLVKGVSDVRVLINEISSASAAQSSGISVVDNSVRSIDGTTQQNAALVEQVAAAAMNLSKQTEILTGLTRRFRVPANALQ